MTARIPSRRLALGALGALLALPVLPAAAQEARIGVAARLTSIDPHGIAFHFFDPLVGSDEHQRPVPALAESWVAIDPTTWEFRLRRGVTFHDGTPLTTADVAFTIDRLPKVLRSPASFAHYVQPITAVEIMDDHRIRFRTERPFPLLPTYLGVFGIVSRRHGEGATTADYHSGRAMIGTGPYRFVGYVPGESLTMERNSSYWRGAEPWARVSFRMIANDAARVAALMAGDVDMINNPPPPDVERLSRDSRVNVFRRTASSVYYIHLDRHRQVSPHFTDRAGNPLRENPLNDHRVRRAMSMAINRQALVERVMGGLGEPASQLMSEGFFGTSPNLQVEPYDPDGARRLLAESGYPDGFVMTMHGPNDRYPNVSRLLQALAQMFTRAGIETRLEAMPSSVLFPRSSNLEYSVVYLGAANFTGEASGLLNALLATTDRAKRAGSTNRGRYSNPEMDALLERAVTTIDDREREDLLVRATDLAIRDVGLIPVVHPMNAWATQRGLEYHVHAEARTYAMRLRAR
jgi:peptide/nickel transport system substrate-binding protein